MLAATTERTLLAADVSAALLLLLPVGFGFSLVSALVAAGALRRTALGCVFPCGGCGCGFSAAAGATELLESVSDELPVSVSVEEPLVDVLPDVELELLPLSMFRKQNVNTGFSSVHKSWNC